MFPLSATIIILKYIDHIWKVERFWSNFQNFYNLLKTTNELLRKMLDIALGRVFQQCERRSTCGICAKHYHQMGALHIAETNSFTFMAIALKTRTTGQRGLSGQRVVCALKSNEAQLTATLRCKCRMFRCVGDIATWWEWENVTVRKGGGMPRCSRQMPECALEIRLNFPFKWHYKKRQRPEMGNTKTWGRFHLKARN